MPCNSLLYSVIQLACGSDISVRYNRPHALRQLLQAANIKPLRGDTMQCQLLQCGAAGCYHRNLCSLHTTLLIKSHQAEDLEVWQYTPWGEHVLESHLGDWPGIQLMQQQGCEPGGCRKG